MTHGYSGLGPVLLWTAPMFDLGLNFDLNYTPVKFRDSIFHVSDIIALTTSAHKQTKRHYACT